MINQDVIGIMTQVYCEHESEHDDKGLFRTALLALICAIALPVFAQGTFVINRDYEITLPDGWAYDSKFSGGFVYTDGESTLIAFPPEVVADLVKVSSSSTPTVLAGQLVQAIYEFEDAEIDSDGIADYDTAEWNYVDGDDLEGVFVV
jgi:hypothetical protein